MKISWVNYKDINFENVNSKIKNCIEIKHLTNGGKNVINLQSKIKELFKLEENKEVLMVSNGAMGINALVGGLNIYFEKKLRWAVQSFTFPCSKQGLLIDSLVLDIDENMGPNLKELNEKINDYDGIIITNCFGCSCNIKLYEDFCKKNNKILLFDNAASSMTYYDGKNHLNYGNGCIVSLHHTKPIGFGEGGFIVFDKEYLNCMKKSICFGFTDTNKQNYEIYASNYKMSEIACIYIDDYLNNLEKIYNHHTNLIKYFIIKLKEYKLDDKIKIYKNFAYYENSLMATIPIIFKDKLDTKYFNENNIEAKKYYYPLDKNCKNSVDLFDRIICLPLNMDMNIESINFYIKLLINIS
jgi:dTDP-4-amino-4,6-dideoxygalactose transaminase